MHASKDPAEGGCEKGTRYRGSAFPQFLLFDSPADPNGEYLSYGFAYDYELVKVPRHRRY